MYTIACGELAAAISPRRVPLHRISDLAVVSPTLRVTPAAAASR